MGVWIETITQTANGFVNEVTPCVGVWIETKMNLHLIGMTTSHPAWVCGLKQDLTHLTRGRPSHTLRGCVD